jgi:hypothetical protein
MDKDHWEDLNVGSTIILKLILEEKDGLIWTGFIWLRLGHVGLLRTR